MTNLPAGAAHDSRAPYNETSITPVKVDVIVYECATQINGCVNNFVVYGTDGDPVLFGWGSTLEKALEDFEQSYINRHEEYCDPIVKETKIQY